MNADAKRVPLGKAMQLLLTVLGTLLMVVPPFALAALGLSSLETTTLAGVEFGSFAVGFVLLYFALRGQGSSE